MIQKYLRNLNQPTELRSVNPLGHKCAGTWTQKITIPYGKTATFTFPLTHGPSDNHVISSSRQKPHEKVLRQLTKEIQYRTCRGQALLLSECWSRFQDLCEKQSVSVPSYYKSRRAFFKYKIIQALPEITIIPRQSIDLEDDIIIISSSLSMVDVFALLKDDSSNEELKVPAYSYDPECHSFPSQSHHCGISGQRCFCCVGSKLQAV